MIRVAVPLSLMMSFQTSNYFESLIARLHCLQVRIAVFSQHHVDGLDLSSNPLLYMMRCYPVSSLYSLIINCVLYVLWELELFLNYKLDYQSSRPSYHRLILHEESRM